MDRERDMRRALELAERGWGRVSPNPLVGCVIVRDGRIVGEGWHEGPGTEHAEAMALRLAGTRAAGATAFATLEPCDHHGRTPPCARALIEAGVEGVIAATRDPNPMVDGSGFRALREAGLAVEEGLLAEEAIRQNIAFRTHVRTGRPFVILKMASSLDGKAAARDGSSRWITGERARADVQRLRAWADAIVVGSGTALADDPALTVRDPAFASARPPVRVIVDPSGRVPGDRRAFDAVAPTIVAATEGLPAARRQEWLDAGADVALLDGDPAGGVSLPALVDELGKRDVQGLVLEGGPTLAWSAVRDGVVDQLVLYLAPALVGGRDAIGWLAGEGFAPIDRAHRVEVLSVERLGSDLKVVADVHRDR
ncbi:MAG TPA: bifunctional diaminohydroxyphosphoribosylaminopyrimidine deaminase/5-amino-6-(5-phosphoribosylamino)uracil reductase RibD [Actinomycetota bacterium]|nr:bifunctional diaminohydroxyphosphoribosylaminopyrimidine deaminase/5-amino-6-(5-phosphoribosylamino)uracil reductase RibD [Actinomycetota bacterium]